MLDATPTSLILFGEALPLHCALVQASHTSCRSRAYEYDEKRGGEGRSLTSSHSLSLLTSLRSRKWLGTALTFHLFLTDKLPPQRRRLRRPTPLHPPYLAMKELRLLSEQILRERQDPRWDRKDNRKG
jgi:hypothetical protein